MLHGMMDKSSFPNCIEMFTTVGDSFDEDDFGDISRQDESLALPGPIYDRLKPYDEDVNHLSLSSSTCNAVSPLRSFDKVCTHASCIEDFGTLGDSFEEESINDNDISAAVEMDDKIDINTSSVHIVSGAIDNSELSKPYQISGTVNTPLQKESLKVFDFTSSDATQVFNSTYSGINGKISLNMSGGKNYCCYKRCSDSEVNPRTIGRIQEMKRGKSKFELKQILLDNLYAQQNVGVSVNFFSICGQLFCRESVRRIFGLSKHIINEVFDAYACGQRFFVHGNTRGMSMKSSTIGFICWMKQFALNYGNFSPDEEGVIVISSCFTIKDVFTMYSLQAPKPLVAKSTFYALFASKFGPKRDDKTLPQVRISSYSSHSRCDQCLLLEQLQRRCRTEEDLAVIKSLKQEHRLLYSRARIAIEEKRTKALTDPAGHIYVQIDDMDNKKVSDLKCI